MRWMIYGADGHPGALVSRLAAARGQRPVLAGRDPAALRALAAELRLDAVTLDVADPPGLRAALDGVRVVAHCAGPFGRTSAPMVDACLTTGTHYLDVTGELPVLQAVLDRAGEAVAAGVVLLTGAGCEVVPTDCLAALLAEKLISATTLELAVYAPGGFGRGPAGPSGATAGGLRRQGGVLRPTSVGLPAREVPFPSGTRRAGAVSCGAVVTAYHSTGIADITGYAGLPDGRSLGRALASGVRRLWDVAGPYAPAGRAGRRRPSRRSARVPAVTGVEVWAQVRDPGGRSRSATLTGPRADDLTADAVVRAALRLPQVRPGAHTPATAFGPRFLDSLDGVQVRLR